MGEETIVQRAVRIMQEERSKEREPHALERMLSGVLAKFACVAMLGVGLAVIPLHQLRHDDAPEIPLLVFSATVILLAAAGLMPAAVRLAGATARQLLPAKWRGNGGG